MQPHAAERRHLERQIAYARPVFMVLALVDLLQRPPADRGAHAVLFVLVYLGVAVGLVLFEFVPPLNRLRVPLAADIAALAAFLLLSHSAAAFWFLYLFVALAAGIRWGLERSIVLAGVVTLAMLVRATLNGGFGWMEVLSWVALAVGTFTAGVGLAFLGDRNRLHAAEHEFLSRLTSLLQVDKGVTESLRLLLEELANGFGCEKAAFAFRDVEAERIFVWSVTPGKSERLAPESLPLARSDVFLLDRPEASVCWNQMEGAGSGFAWNHETGVNLAEPPRMPASARKELGMRSMLNVTVDLRAIP